MLYLEHNPHDYVVNMTTSNVQSLLHLWSLQYTDSGSIITVVKSQEIRT